MFCSIILLIGDLLFSTCTILNPTCCYVGFSSSYFFLKYVNIICLFYRLSFYQLYIKSLLFNISHQMKHQNKVHLFIYDIKNTTNILKSIKVLLLLMFLLILYDILISVQVQDVLISTGLMWFLIFSHSDQSGESQSDSSHRVSITNGACVDRR
jgi:hypothetical protein